jgi:hypothetical protein
LPFFLYESVGGHDSVLVLIDVGDGGAIEERTSRGGNAIWIECSSIMMGCCGGLE